MYSETSIAKMEFILMMIEDIELIIERHNGIDIALNDFEGQPALLMCLMQIGESLAKIKEKEIIEKLPVKLSYKMRNIIAHDYLGIDKNIIIKTIQDDIPKLKKDISKILEK